MKEILSLDSNKVCRDTNVPTKIVKENAEIFYDSLTTSLNRCVKDGNFSAIFKLADITQLYQNGSKNLKGNYRLITILAKVFKIFEKFIFKQIVRYLDKMLSKYQCGFHNAQHCLVTMLKKWKSCNDKGKVFCVQSISKASYFDLSKELECFFHSLIIAKLHTYGFDAQPLN